MEAMKTQTESWVKSRAENVMLLRSIVWELLAGRLAVKNWNLHGQFDAQRRRRRLRLKRLEEKSLKVLGTGRLEENRICHASSSTSACSSSFSFSVLHPYSRPKGRFPFLFLSFYLQVWNEIWLRGSYTTWDRTGTYRWSFFLKIFLYMTPPNNHFF